MRKGVKEISRALLPSFNSKLPAEELSILNDTDPQENAQGIDRKQNAIAMDALVQSMSDIDDFHCILQHTKEDADWPGGKAWKVWKNIQSRSTINQKILQPQGT